VSQGTVRKALDALAADNLVERRQGKGTFVSQHTQESALFRFFKLTADEGEPALPTCRQSSISQRRASRDEAEQLGLEPKADVFIIRRERFVDDAPRISEMMALSADLFPGLDAHHPLPNTLYAFYQSEYGVSIVGATERIKAIGADKDVSRALQVEQGRPVLSVERTALDLNGRAVEYRRSCYLTEGLHYAVRLS
ncbi:MAG: GntR family transcriptional regulator, partial [Pseudomonadota bacterium]